MNNILCPVDFSDSSFSAARAAALLAGESGAQLHLVNVFHIPNPLQTLPIELIVTADELEKETDSRMKQLAGLLESNELERSRIHLHSRNGGTAKEILDIAEYLDADLIVMGMRKESLLKDFLTVNPAEKVIRKGHRPLLVLPGNSKLRRPKHILFATDGEAPAESDGTRLLINWCRNFGADLKIVHLHQHREKVEQEKIMDTIEPAFSTVVHSYSFPETERLSESILAIAKDSEADLIAVEAHDHSILARLTGQDHSDEIVHLSVLPVLILHR